MMESEGLKKRRLTGEHTHNAQPDLSAPLASRPAPRERIKSAPQFPPVASAPKTPSQTPSRWTSPAPPAEAKVLATSNAALEARTSDDSRPKPGSHGEPIKEAGNLQEVVLAVLGASAVGKSTFLQLSLDLRKLPDSPVASKKVLREGSMFLVRLVEVDVDDVDVSSEGLVWPEFIEDEPMPSIDGVLLLYNVLDPSSIAPLPPVLTSLYKGGIPTVVVASNCDQSPRTWRVDYGKIEKLCTRFEGIECFQTSLNVSETHKRCVSVVLRNVMLEKQRNPPASQRQQAERIANRQSESKPQRSHTKQDSTVQDEQSHGEDEDEAEQTCDSHAPHQFQSSNNPKKIRPNGQEEGGSRAKTPTEKHETSQDNEKMNTPTTPDRQGIRKRGSIGSDEDTKEGGVSFDDLVDRLLSQPMSKSDSQFAAIFLCIYRKFATPSDLLIAILERFEEVHAMESPMLVRLTSQLRYLAILRDWVADYPGDFANQMTRRMMMNFLQGLGSTQAFAVACKEIAPYLDVVHEDEDIDWTYSSKGRSRASTTDSFLTRSSVHSDASTVTADSSTEDNPEQAAVDEDLMRKAARISSNSSTSSSTGRSMAQSNSSTQVSLRSLEGAQRQAQSLNPTPKIALDKVRWHQLMDIPEELIAKELTRIDWILYSSIRCRDLIRQVTLPTAQRENCKGLEHVNRMINHFNHIAFWVAHWILLRDKPKHRARALEKFMGVAWKLRHLNNYNSLGAVLAGINGTAVHRLKQTRELIPPESQKQFMRLEILMGTQRSHFAYRLAWENTSTPRIPFLPLHRRDLVFGEEANRTFIYGAERTLINWKKFEVMGQVIVEIRKSQEMPYSSIRRNEEVQRLVLDGAFSKEDDELYERSTHLEKPGLGEAPRRKFTLFQR